MKRTLRARLLMALMLLGIAMLAIAAVYAWPVDSVSAASDEGTDAPDWVLIAVALLGLVIGRTVIHRIARAGRREPD